MHNKTISELSKLIDNSYRDTIFAYSNQMSLLAAKYKSVSVYLSNLSLFFLLK